RAPSGVVEEVPKNLIPCHRGDADLFHFHPAGDVGQSDGGLVAGPTRQGQAEDAQHHVAGAGDVVHLPWTGWEYAVHAAGAGEGHAVLVKRDDAGFEVERVAELRGGGQRGGGRGNVAAGGQRRLEPVR